MELIRARLVQPLFEQHLPEALIQVRKRLGLPAAAAAAAPAGKPRPQHARSVAPVVDEEEDQLDATTRNDADDSRPVQNVECDMEVGSMDGDPAAGATAAATQEVNALLDVFTDCVGGVIRGAVEAELDAVAQLMCEDSAYSSQHKTDGTAALDAGAAAQVTCAFVVSRLRKCIDRGLEKQFKEALFRRANVVLGVMRRVACPGPKLFATLDKLETQILAAAAGEAQRKAMGRYAGGQMRRRLMGEMLCAASQYVDTASGDGGGVSLFMLRLAWSRSRAQLSRDESELVYLLDKLAQIEGEKISDATWRDVCEAWVALISLRSKIGVERGQAVLECIVSDAAVLDGLGAATLLMQMKGATPIDLLTMLNQGPGAHIRAHAYKYHRVLTRELICIRRVKDLQWQIVTFIGSAIVSAMVGFANFLSLLLYEAYQSGRPAAD